MNKGVISSRMSPGRQTFRLVAGLFVLVVLCFSARAQQVFYVSPDGDDMAAGTLAEPLRTVQRAMDLVEPGDTVYLREGTYREHVAARTNGTATLPITLAAYSNEVPVIKGSKVVTGWTVHDAPVWKVESWTNRSQQVFADGALLQQIGPGGDEHYFPIGLDLQDLMEGSFWHDTNTWTLYVWLTGDANPNEAEMEASVGDFLSVVDTGAHYILDGITVRHSNLIRFWPAVFLGPSGVFRNGEISWCDYNGIALRDASTVENSYLAYNGGGGVFGSESNLVVRGNTIERNNYRGFNTSTVGAGAKFFGASGLMVASNYFHGNYGQALWVDYCRDDSVKTVVGNVVEDTELHPLRPYGITVGIFVEVSHNVLVANNLVNNNQLIGIQVAESDHVRVYNNTIANTQGRYGLEARLNARYIPVSKYQTNEFAWVTFTSNQVFNNIFYDNHQTSADIRWPVESPSTNMVVEGNQLDDNLYFRNGTTPVFESGGVVWSNLALFAEATGHDTNSLAENPRLSAPADGDYRLSSDSVGIDRGRAVAEIADGVDLAGVARVQFGGIDLGAYEFDGSPAAYAPDISITTSNLVCYDTLHVEGRNNANVIGEIWALVIPPNTGIPVTRLSDTEWVLDEWTLEPGVEYAIEVVATNLYGEVATDNKLVERGGIGTGMPTLGITTEPPYYTLATEYSFAGTNNMHVTGLLTWTNYFNRVPVSSGTAPAGVPDWALTASGLQTGLNHIVIQGMNDWEVATVVTAVVNQGETPIHYVATNAPTPLYPYASWETAAREIMDALDAASDGDTVRVGPGTYDRGGRQNERGFSRVLLDKGVVLESVDGPEQTIIWGFREGSPQATRGVLMTHSNAVLRGFTIQNGRALFGLNAEHAHGGGVLVVAGLLVEDCIIRDNTALPWGSGGGAMLIRMAGEIRDVVFEDNAASAGGGLGILWGQNTIASRLIATGNEANDAGGGFWVDNCMNFRNVGAWSNVAGLQGGGIALANNSAILNASVEGNVAQEGGGVAFLEGVGRLVSSIAWSNAPAPVWASSNELPHRVLSSIVPEGLASNWTQSGTIHVDPVYVDPLAQDYRIQESSPARDAGLSSIWHLLNTDLDGHARLVGPEVDMGPYEYWQTAWLDISMTGYLAGVCMPASLSLDWADDRTLSPERLTLSLPAEWTICEASDDNGPLVVEGHSVVFSSSYTGGHAVIEMMLAAPESGPDTTLVFGTGTGTLSKAEVETPIVFESETVQLETYYWLEIGQVGAGAVLATNAWRAPGQVVTVAATADPGWRLRGWLGDTANATTNTDGSLVVTMDQARQITADFVELMQLNVVSDFPDVQPPPGTHIIDRGDRVVFEARSVVAQSNRTYMVADWVGTGSFPANGFEKAFSVVIDDDSTLEWHWCEVAAQHASRGTRVAGVPVVTLNVDLFHDPEANVDTVWYRPALPEGSTVLEVEGDGAPQWSDGVAMAASTNASGWTSFRLEVGLPSAATGVLELSGTMGVNVLADEAMTDF
jgi:parallel beta-helix repeat protein